MARIRSSLRYDESQTPPVQNCNLVLAILQRNHLRPVVTLFSSGFLWGLQYSLTVGLLFWSSKTRLALLRVSLPCGLPDDPTTRKNYDEDTHCASIIANSLRCMVAASRYVSTDRGQTPGCPCASHFTLRLVLLHTHEQDSTEVSITIEPAASPLLRLPNRLRAFQFAGRWGC